MVGDFVELLEVEIEIVVESEESSDTEGRFTLMLVNLVDGVDHLLNEFLTVTEVVCKSSSQLDCSKAQTHYKNSMGVYKLLWFNKNE